jgi:hypothetical protein
VNVEDEVREEKRTTDERGSDDEAERGGREEARKGRTTTKLCSSHDEHRLRSFVLDPSPTTLSTSPPH